MVMVAFAHKRQVAPLNIASYLLLPKQILPVTKHLLNIGKGSEGLDLVQWTLRQSLCTTYSDKPARPA